MRPRRSVGALLAKCCALLAFCLIACSVIIAVPAANDWMAAYADKIRMLEQTPSPRIIFIGGSGTAFGLNSGEVSRAFHLPVINTGLHAGLGLRFMLGHVGPFLRAGDVVVVIPEYGTLRERSSEDRELWCEALLSDVPESLHGASLLDLPDVLAGFPPYAQQKLIIDPLQKLLRSGGVRREYISSRATFDSHGDEVGHLGWPQPAHDFGHDRLETEVEGRVSLLRRFAEEQEHKGVRVTVTFQAFDSTVFDENRVAIARIADIVRTSLGSRVIGTPEEGVIPDEDIFNTPDHPNGPGRELNTARIVKELQGWFARVPASR
jgi:hypothetical protein